MITSRATSRFLSLRRLPIPVLLLLVACGKDANQPGPGPAAIVIAAGGVQRGPVGQPLDTVLTIRITDSRGDPVSGVEVHFWINDQDAGQVAPPFDTTDVNGLARSAWTLGTLAGRLRQALASAPGLDTVIFQATSVAGDPSEILAVSGDSQSALVGTALDSEVVVIVRDQFGNSVPSTIVDLAVKAGGGQVTPLTSVTDSQGLVRAAWTIGTSPGYDTLSATVTGLTPAYIGAEAHPVPPVDSVDLGVTHTCRLDDTGQTSCWGLNFAGEVGSGDTLSAFSPRVLAGAPLFKTITAGGYHGCGLTAQSGLYCWGTMRTLLGVSPTAQSFPQTFTSIAAGLNFMCGVAAQSQAFCWGENSSSQLGDGSTTPRSAPSPVGGGLRFRQIGAGITHACGLTTNGRAHCWGSGPLGTGGPGPDPFRSLRFVSIAVGWDANCGLTLTGEAWCWGSGPPTLSSSTLRFSGLAVAEGAFCGVGVTGIGYCWGRNDFGQLGDGTQTTRATPAPVAGGLTFSSISMGEIHACGVTQTGELHCWGGNEAVAVGVGETMRSRSPIAVTGGLQFTSLTAGDGVTCGVTAATSAYCWGRNSGGELGDGTNQGRTSPVAVGGGFTFSQVSAGTGTTCGITPSAVGLCWGDNSYGQSGQGSPGPSHSTPSPIGGGLSVAEIAAGRFHVCVRTTADDGYCWGDNFLGQVGDSTFISRAIPVAVVGAHHWMRLSAGVQFTCGITAGGWGMCWGTRLALGNGGIDRAFPDSVHVGVTLIRIATSGTTTNACGLGADQVAYCWGNGDVGQLGDGSNVAVAFTPVAVIGGHLFQEIGVGNAHSCGLTTGGAAYCWGGNWTGSLGDGTMISRTVPTAVIGGHVFTQLAVGSTHACGLDAGGTAYCWGDNYYGQLGLGVSAIFLTPVRVQ